MEKFSYNNLKELFDKYESHLSSFMLIAGFIFDYLTLNRVDFIWDNILIVLHLLIIGSSIMIINLYEEGRLKNGLFQKIHAFAPLIMQFSFGGLFSAFVVFYSKSASFVSSGAFVVILIGLLVGNEFFKKRYQRLVFQLALYFVSIFSFSIYFFPVLIGRMGTLIFLGSGAISLLTMSVFVLMLSRLSPIRYMGDRNVLIMTISGLYVLINFLYFTNIIPPIPLSLKSGDVYHFVQKDNRGDYIALGEADSRWNKILRQKVVRLTTTEPVYVFGSVFAPTRLNTKIIHDWQYLDVKTGNWVSASRISFEIFGGRDNGYRGYSKKENIFPGKWRVDIETERGQVIGRVRFNIVYTDTPVKLETVSL